jgi:FtsP/CotA-like multicopper oxidase with cupredoxin domain
MVAPRDSFVARFTPPRSGSFMYHAHVSESAQITSGLFAPIIVTDDGKTPANDHVFVFSQNGPDDLAKIALNGQEVVDTLRVPANTAQRIRLVNITANDEVSGELGDSTASEKWQRVAKDGAALPSVRQRAEPARFHIGPGEILDVSVSLRAGTHLLHLRSFNNFDVPIVAR